MEEALLIPLGAFLMITAIVGLVQAGNTIRYYLDWRLRMAERQAGGSEGSVLRAVQELRAEIAALKREELEALDGGASVVFADGHASFLPGGRIVGGTALPYERPVINPIKDPAP